MTVDIITRPCRSSQANRFLHSRMSRTGLNTATGLAGFMTHWGRKPEAITSYQQALALGQNRREYYGARAALQLGYIYESQGDKKTHSYISEKCWI